MVNESGESAASEPIPYRLVLDDAPRSADIAVLDDQLSAFNVGRTGYDDGRELAVWLRDAAGALVGGLYGWTWGGWLEVRFLWLRDALRGQGHGRALLHAVEAEATRRGCRGVFLDSYSFQAPEFYEGLGYETFAVLADFPRAHRRHFLRKALIPAPVDAPHATAEA